MNTMLMRKLSIGLLSFLLIFFSTAQICRSEGTINFGVIGPMKYTQGKELWNGAILAAEEINEKGGVNVGGDIKRINLVKVDSHENVNAAIAANAIEMLFFRHMVDFVVGGFRSEAVFAMQDAAMDHKTIFISAGAAAPELTQRVAQNYERYKYYFRGGTFNNFDLGKACFLQLGYVAQKLREELGVKTIKVAIAAEKTRWVGGSIAAAKKYFPRMGLELTGVFWASSVATDVSSTIRAIADTKALLVLTLFSGNVGIPFVSQATDLKLPAILVGINAEAQRQDFWNSTGGRADYVITLAAFAPGVEITGQTRPFVNKYMQRFGDVPSYTASGTYTAIADTLVPSIEQAGTLDSDTIVSIIERGSYETPQGIFEFDIDGLGRQLHEIKFGANYALPIAIQWQHGKMRGVWPNNYQEKPGAPTLTYSGIMDFKIPQWIIREHRNL